MANLSDKLLRQAFQARRENRHADAERDLIEAVGVCRTNGARPELARALTALGQVERDRHRGEAALHCYEEAVDCTALRAMRCGWRTQCDTWETFIAKPDVQIWLGPVITKPWVSIGVTRKLRPSIWRMRFAAWQF